MEMEEWEDQQLRIVLEDRLKFVLAGPIEIAADM